MKFTESQIIKLYKKAHPRLASNFIRDTFLPAKKRKAFLKHLGNFSKGDMVSWLEQFFFDKKNQQVGPPAKIGPGEVLGAARLFTAFTRTLMAKEILDCEPHIAEETIRLMVSLEEDDVIEYIRATFPPFSKLALYQMWSFQSSEGDKDAFYALVTHDISCRLGLPSYGTGDHVIFGHILVPKLNAFKPTCLDAGIMPEWAPGGRTKPLKPCKAKYKTGLEEIVHNPNFIHNVVTKIAIV
ncbi:MAG TPA: hypothetical protein VGZ93_11700 [Candidatus Methylacidiphilales bacterium]|jgi:hypothetical protein|nr:hypothetical protein [Candidatus Methylacidiphilales bacterium]